MKAQHNRCLAVAFSGGGHALAGLVSTILLAQTAVGCQSRDDGSPGSDAGATTVDGGNFGSDADAPVADGGSVPNDGGTAPGDAGTGATDGGGALDASVGTDAGCSTTTYHRDADGDGRGDPGDAMTVCGDAPSGYVADNTDCLDSDRDVHPGAAERCNAVDDDCDGMVNGPLADDRACMALAGDYTTPYRMYTAERLGSTVINQVTCTGDAALTVNLAANPAVQGTVTCAYAGSLSGFAHAQSGTYEAYLTHDGAVTGRVTHSFNPSDSGFSRAFDLNATIVGDQLTGTGTGSWRPHPMSAVPWEVEIRFGPMP